MPLDNPETPPLISRLCRDCRHWELRKTIRETPTGECRKSAPTPVFATRHRLQWLARLVRVAKLEWRGAWPLTHENDWCSEHAPKPARIRGWGDGASFPNDTDEKLRGRRLDEGKTS